MPEPIALSWSGGKDSSLALAALRADPRVDVVALMTSVTRGYDRISIHGVRRSLLDAQIAAIGLPLIEVPLEMQSSHEAYRTAFLAACAALRDRHPTLRRVAFGDLFLDDVRAYRDELLAEAELAGHYPLWGEDTARLARRFIDDGFRAHLVCVDTTQIDGAFAGRPFDDALLADLPASADPCGERGEFHTFVSAGPIFSAPISVDVGEIVLRENRFMYCDLLPGEAR